MIKGIIRSSEGATRANRRLKRGFIGPVFDFDSLKESLTQLMGQRAQMLRKAIYETDAYGDVLSLDTPEGRRLSYSYGWKRAPISLYQAGVIDAQVTSADCVLLHRFTSKTDTLRLTLESTLTLTVLADKKLTLSKDKAYYKELEGACYQIIAQHSRDRFTAAIRESFEDLCDYKLRPDLKKAPAPKATESITSVSAHYAHRLTLTWSDTLTLKCSETLKPERRRENEIFGKDAELIEGYQEWAESVP